MPPVYHGPYWRRGAHRQWNKGRTIFWLAVSATADVWVHRLQGVKISCSLKHSSPPVHLLHQSQPHVISPCWQLCHLLWTTAPNLPILPSAGLFCPAPLGRSE